MYEKALIPIEDQQSYGEVHAAIASRFAAGNVQNLLKDIAGAGLRIRDFEGVASAGLFGEAVAASYKKLGNADQGQIREFYLAAVEKVDPALRAKYLKLYAYY
ncbi:MAG TPA: hypothetical protein VNU94_03725 [Acidobacteriaceae bacterium]|jgi:hypothetical protein|nr:hypothetical protein [Acidobacteriaceae bacterium]